jgi:ADP-ribose pyrophosphatase YjhB (NUDIX family)
MKVIEPHDRFTIELSMEELNRIAIRELKEYVALNTNELRAVQIHKEDDESCRKVISACLVLLEYNGEWGWVRDYIQSNKDLLDEA